MIAREQIEFFQTNGYLIAGPVLDEQELAAARAAYDRIFNATEKPSSYRNLGQKEGEELSKGAVLQIIDMHKLDDAFARILHKPAILDMVEGILGTPDIRLYHDQALFKEGSGGFTPWHQDQHYWPLDTDKTITMWMPLIDITPDMGPMTFVSESNRGGYLAPLQISDESEDYFERLVRERGWRTSESTFMAAGDATFHTGWTLHRASPNTTGKMREVMTIIYYADGTRVSPIHAGNEADLKRWLPGAREGDRAASPLNPLLYSAS